MRCMRSVITGKFSEMKLPAYGVTVLAVLLRKSFIRKGGWGESKDQQKIVRDVV